MSPCEAKKLNDFRVGPELRSVAETIVRSLPRSSLQRAADAAVATACSDSATKTHQVSTVSFVKAALTATVTLSHSAVRRAKSWDTAERLRLIAMALPPDW